MTRPMPRRDLCYVVGRRANKLTTDEAAVAWFFLARHLERLGERDIPKFKDVLAGIRTGTLAAKRKRP
jgi:hypothetical protein